MVSDTAKAEILKLEAKGMKATAIYERLKPDHRGLKKQNVVNTITWARQKARREKLTTLTVVDPNPAPQRIEPTSTDVMAAQLHATAIVLKTIKLIASQTASPAQERLDMILKALE